MGTPKQSQALALKSPSGEKDGSHNRLAIAIDYGTTFTGVAFASPSHARPDPLQAFLAVPGLWSRPEHEGDFGQDQVMNRLNFVFSGIPGVEEYELAVDYFSPRKSKFRAAASQLSDQAIRNPKEKKFILCDAGGETVDIINYNVSYPIPTFVSNHSSPYTFPAKEETQFGAITSAYKHLLRYEMIENDTNSNLGDLETVWNSVASHPSYKSPIQVVEDYLRVFFVTGFPKGRNVEWGSLQDPSFHHARIGQLFDRDYVWVVTQTMVSFEKLALWAVHNVFIYKVYPGFWGRKVESWAY